MSPITTRTDVGFEAQLPRDDRDASAGPCPLTDVDLAGERGDGARRPDVDPRTAGGLPRAGRAGRRRHDDEAVTEHLEPVAVGGFGEVPRRPRPAGLHGHGIRLRTAHVGARTP